MLREIVEPSLQPSEDSLRLFVQHLPVAAAMLDRDLRYMVVSQRWLSDYGCDQPIFLQQSLASPLLEVPDRWLEIAQRCLAGATETCEADQLQQPDGSTAWVRWQLSPWYSKAEEIGGLFCLIHAIAPPQPESVLQQRISQLEQQLQQAQQSERFLRTAIDATPDWIFIKNQQFQYQLVNRSFANALGQTPEDIIGKDDLALGFPPAHVFGDPSQGIRGFRSDDEAVLAGQPIYNPYDPAQTADGSVHIFDTQKLPLYDAEGHVFAVMGFSRDITERQQAEQALAERALLAAFRAEVDTALTQSDTLSDALHRCTDAVVHHLKVAFARIWTLNVKDNVLELQASSGLYTHLDGPHGRVPVGQFKIGLIAQERQPHVTNSVLDDPRIGDKDWAKREGMVAFVGYPLIVEDQLVGVIAMFSRQPIHEQMLRAIEFAAGEISLGIRRKQAEDALRQSEAKLQNLSANVPGMLYQFVLRPDGSQDFLFVSSGCRDICELEPEQIQQDVNLLLDQIHPEERSAFETSVAVSAQTLQPLRWEGRFVSPSGKRKWIQGASRPELQSDGCVVWNGVLMDISDRKKIEEDLRSSEQKLSILFRQTSLALLEWNRNFEIIAWNPAAERIFGYSSHEAIGCHAADLVVPEAARPHVDEVFSQLLNRKSGVHSINENITKDGKTIVCEWHNTPLIDETGQVIAVAALALDITERRRAEEALRESEAQLRQQANDLEQALHELQQAQTQLVQSEKMSSLGQLVAGVAHEINNPVNFIYGNLTPASEYTQDLLNLLQLYQQQYPEPGADIEAEIEAIDLEFLVEDLPKLLASMKVGADRIRQIVLSLRNFSRLDEAAMKPVNIHEGIDSTLLLLQNRLKAKAGATSVQLEKHYGQLPLVECYAGQLNQVFMNILTNALDALEEYDEQRSAEAIKQQPSAIAICTEVIDDQRIAIRISDNGPGMPESVRNQLFNPFFTTKAVGKGTGLGLAISYQIVTEKHGGSLTCRSTLGKGTEFSIEIPLCCHSQRSVSPSCA